MEVSSEADEDYGSLLDLQFSPIEMSPRHDTPTPEWDMLMEVPDPVTPIRETPTPDISEYLDIPEALTPLDRSPHRPLKTPEEMSPTGKENQPPDQHLRVSIPWTRIIKGRRHRLKIGDQRIPIRLRVDGTASINGQPIEQYHRHIRF